MAWHVEPDGRCVPISRREDLLTEAEALVEDLQVAITELSIAFEQTQTLLDESHRQRRLRGTTLRLVKSDDE